MSDEHRGCLDSVVLEIVLKEGRIGARELYAQASEFSEDELRQRVWSLVGRGELGLDSRMYLVPAQKRVG